MRSDINYIVDKNNKIYVKDKSNIYEFKNISDTLFIKYWNEIQEGNFTIDNQKSPLKSQLLNFLNSIKAFSEPETFEEQLKDMGLGKKQSSFSDYTIGICGESDLVDIYLNHFPSRFKKLEIGSDDSEKYDFGLIIGREDNTKHYLELNEIMFEKGIPYNSLLFSKFEVIVGPYTIPNQTSCLKCMRLHELDNNFYGHILSKFTAISDRNEEVITSEILNLGFSFLEEQVVKQILNSQEVAIEIENVQKVLSYQFLEGMWEEHYLLKHPECELCFPASEQNEQIFEVNLK
ncbi:hypothetical protein [Streptococcus gallolyticus]|uniref:hypothetical protein n=1 Tax=Streptococcus gallolyticus TaxID=315405 RepID=UPI002284E521|nr:hypothetical protein [Streptococcus gallolyticus]MCY7156107.1 hypothetical protein [Streptococcus gallolyticus subsp. gallolyticus]